MTIVIRHETPDDIDAIADVVKAGFSVAERTTQTEHLIINELRRTGQLAISLVAEEDGKIIGQIGISPVGISNGSEGWFGLGPLSVLPDHQKRGIGTQLVNEAMEELKKQNAAGCVVLGAPEFYGRLGFTKKHFLVLPGILSDHFQAKAFRGKIPAGMVSFPEAWVVL